VQERQKLLRAYLDKRRIDPKRIASYIDRQLGDRDSISGSELTIYGVEDFIAFTHVRHLAYLPGAQRLARQYTIERQDGWVDNDWVKCPDFIVFRRGTEHSGGAVNAA
jgi:hypothetical protein